MRADSETPPCCTSLVYRGERATGTTLVLLAVAAGGGMPDASAEDTLDCWADEIGGDSDWLELGGDLDFFPPWLEMDSWDLWRWCFWGSFCCPSICCCRWRIICSMTAELTFCWGCWWFCSCCCCISSCCNCCCCWLALTEGGRWPPNKSSADTVCWVILCLCLWVCNRKFIAACAICCCCTCCWLIPAFDPPPCPCPGSSWVLSITCKWRSCSRWRTIKSSIDRTDKSPWPGLFPATAAAMACIACIPPILVMAAIACGGIFILLPPPPPPL